jgi:SAM-dependent methyltransferase
VPRGTGQTASIQAESLTIFYLTLSAGGAAGGLFVGLLAPLIFPAFWEHYLGLLAACVIALVVYFDHRGWWSEDARPSTLWVGLGILLFVGVGTVFAAAVTSYTSSVAMVRNFYGVMEVQNDSIEDAIDPASWPDHARPAAEWCSRAFPTMYYGFKTGVGRAIEELRQRRSNLKIGLVGLGVGTLAAYGQAGYEFRFYEINENVTRLAKEHFTFLKNCPSEIEIVHGDARLMLENESPQNFDLLVLDAFSGDAIPTHLLTQEAMQSWLRHLRSDGLIAIHISNIHFDLRRVTEALAAASGLNAMTLETIAVLNRSTGTESLTEPGSRWVLMAREPELLNRSRFAEIASKTTLSVEQQVLWTDDFSNLIEVLDWE